MKRINESEIRRVVLSTIFASLENHGIIYAIPSSKRKNKNCPIRSCYPVSVKKTTYKNQLEIGPYHPAAISRLSYKQSLSKTSNQRYQSCKSFYNGDHSVNSVQIRIFFWSSFSRIGLNMAQKKLRICTLFTLSSFTKRCFKVFAPNFA